MRNAEAFSLLSAILFLKQNVHVEVGAPWTLALQDEIKGNSFHPIRTTGAVTYDLRCKCHHYGCISRKDMLSLYVHKIIYICHAMSQWSPPSSWTTSALPTRDIDRLIRDHSESYIFRNESLPTIEPGATYKTDSIASVNSSESYLHESYCANAQ